MRRGEEWGCIVRTGKNYQRRQERCVFGRVVRSLLLSGALICCFATCALAEEFAVLRIVPNVTEVVSDGKEVKVTYAISVEPPPGEDIGVFSFRLKPSGGMSLPTQFKEDGEQVIRYEANGLPYDVRTETGVFKTYEYTPASSYFAAVGSSEDKRMTEAAQILTITATVPAGASGAFVLDADFLAAKDGSGRTYPAKVETTPVVITVSGQPSETLPDGNTDGSMAVHTVDTVVVTDLDTPLEGARLDAEVTVTTGLSGGSCEVRCVWYCDGAEMAEGEAFASGHIYTVRLHIRLTNGVFGENISANVGYAVVRSSEREIELRRSFYVESNYTQEVADSEAQEQIDFSALTAQWDWDEETAATDAAEQDTARKSGGTEKAAAIVIVTLAVAAMACQLIIPGGLNRLFKRK